MQDIQGNLVVYLIDLALSWIEDGVLIVEDGVDEVFIGNKSTLGVEELIDRFCFFGCEGFLGLFDSGEVLEVF